MNFPTQLKLHLFPGSYFFLYLNLLVFNLPCFAHYDGAYMRNADDGFSTRYTWMSDLRDDVQVSELAIPGTHNSAGYKKLQPPEDLVKGFYKSIASGWAKRDPFYSMNELSGIITTDMQSTQVLNLRQQLQYGIRAFDVSLVFYQNEFGLIHKNHNTFLNIMFDGFLNQILNFLEDNPSETVLFTLKVKEEVGENSVTPKNKLNEYLQDPRLYEHYMKPKNARVTLGEARGKFIIISKDVNFNEFGLNCSGEDVITMDSNYLYTNWDLHYKKWIPAKNHLKSARTGDKNKFYIDYLSGYGGSFPYFVASGHSSPWTSAPRLATGLTTPGWKRSYPDFPRVTCFIGICTIAFEGTNILARDLIHSYNKEIDQQQRSVGIVMADFPGDNLIGTIINNNAKLRK